MNFLKTLLSTHHICNSVGGLHLNPVISMAVALAGKMKTPLMVIPMILAQFAGCLIGAVFYRVWFLAHL